MLSGLPDEQMADAGGPQRSYYDSVKEMRKQMASIPQLSQTGKLAKAREQKALKTSMKRQPKGDLPWPVHCDSVSLYMTSSLAALTLKSD